MSQPTKHDAPQTLKTIRQLKVREAFHAYQLSQNQHQRTPIDEIRLKGHSLIRVEFKINSAVTIRVMRRCVVLT